ncbi:putative amidase [Septoria linicola]|nr:putative amidase [Septoria linicola]
MSSQWEQISQRARQKVLDDIPADWKISQDKLPAEDVLDVTGVPAASGILDEQELAITESLATEIVAKIAKGEWKAEAVTRAFCKRAAIAHQLTKCLTVIMFDDAIKRAKELDTHFEKTGKVTGPLHGLPISLKDNFDVTGYTSSVGFCSWAEEIRKQDSTIVITLKSLGAVPYVKTNVPTAMMIAETVNNTYDRTVNPRNRKTTSGGSSGGESALLAIKGSVLGIGTDIGGSLRIPAACTGTFTLKPSFGRFPHFDARSGLSGQEAVASIHGPMARSIADLRLYAEHVVGTQPWSRDPKCIEIPWRQVEIKSKPKIAVLWDNGMVRPTPPVARALKETVAKLKSQGYEIVEWSNEDHAEAMELLGRFFVADGGTSIEKILEPVGEPWRPEMEPYKQAKDIGAYELWQLQKRRTALAKRYLDRWAAVEGLDAILGPTTPYATPKNGEFRHVGYTCVFNILDYSCVSFPTGISVDKEKDVADLSAKAHSELDAQTQKEYDAELSHGLPVSLQLTGRRLEEEKILALTEKVLHDLES